MFYTRFLLLPVLGYELVLEGLSEELPFLLVIIGVKRAFEFQTLTDSISYNAFRSVSELGIWILYCCMESLLLLISSPLQWTHT